MSLSSGLGLAIAGWCLSELALGVGARARRTEAAARDCGSLRLLWIVIALSISAGVAFRSVELGRIAGSRQVLQWVALAALVVGVVLRWSAILTLGRFFTTNVAVHSDQRIVRSGLFRYVRHPSYTGLLLAFLGVGLAFGNWLSVAAVVVPISLAVGYRIHVEERALLEAFGSAYEDYRQRTKRLVPGIY